MIPKPDDSRFAKRCASVAAFSAAVLAIWVLRSLLLLIFAAVLIAVLLNGLAKVLGRWLHVGTGASFALVLVGLAAATVVTAWLFGAQVAAQFTALLARLPSAWLAAVDQLRAWGVLDQAVVQLRQSLPTAGQALALVSGLISGTGAALAGAGLAVVGGIYLATSPSLYVNGFVALWPTARQPHVRDTLGAVEVALFAWLRARAVSMIAAGILITLGLWTIGLPSFAALGLIAGVVQFVPLVGSILAAVPGILIAVSLGQQALVWTVAVYFAVQQINDRLLSPLVEHRLVALPPALTLFGLIGFGLPLVRFGDSMVTLRFAHNGDRLYLASGGASWTITDVPYERKSAGAGGANPELRSPMPGAVVAIFVEDGAEVEAGTPVLSIEAMKMEHVLRASVAGTVVLQVLPGAQVSADQVVASIVTVRDAAVADEAS